MKMAKSERYIIRIAVALFLAGSVAGQATTAATTAAAQQTTAAANTPNQQTTTNQPAATNAPGTNTNPAIVVTGVPTAVTTSSSSTSDSQSSLGGLSDLPTIAGYGIPTMVIPDTKGAPYMVTSTLPEGTIFICVGALLGFLGVAVLAWRGLVAWSIHRSVKRVNEKLQHQPEKLVKPGYGGAASYANHSNMSMDHVGISGGGTLPRKNNNNTPTRSNIASNNAAARSSSLFFSPTAGHGNNSSTYLPGNRSSSFLPSGYYAAPGAGSPAQGATHTHVGSGAPQRNSKFSRYHDNSPPGSPGLPPSSRGMDSIRGGSHGHGMYYQPSTSSLNLNMPGVAHSGGRAPSANMDDLFDHQAPNAR